jgi:pimeloyl-ACP methyl ester carboxylesterase
MRLSRSRCDDRVGLGPNKCVSIARTSPARWQSCSMRTLIAIFAALFLSNVATAQKTVSFSTEDGGVVFADVYGTGNKGVVLAHGGRFNKESWAPQARTLASAGFKVLALDFRGYGNSRGPGDSEPMSAPLHWDVLAAVRYLRKTGAKSVSVCRRQHGRRSCRRRIDRFGAR